VQSSEIIRKYIFLNPLEYIYLSAILIRLAILIIIGLFLVILFNIKDLKSITKSTPYQKLVGWIIMAPTFLLSVICGGIIALLLISYIVYKSSKEFIEIFNLPKFYFYSLLGIWVSSVIIVLSINIIDLNLYAKQVIYILPIVYLLSIAFISIIRGRLEEVMTRVCYTFFASIWICYTMLHFILLSKTNYGKELLIIIGFSVALSDIFAFCIGKIFNLIGFGTRYKISENISPNKTYAGIIGNLFGASLGIFLLRFLIQQFTIFHLVIFIIIIGISSSFGDMLESLVKRSAGVKDASNAIFGHGGFLDRIDSLLIVIIVVYYYLLFFTEFLK
jgi:phosphatidate cytidylyltransferase